MSYRERLVESYEQVVESTKAFNSGLEVKPELCGPHRNYPNWYYIPEIDAVGPSKFIGYREMTAEFYLDHSGKRDKMACRTCNGLHGGATQSRLKKWFEIAMPGTEEHSMVSEMVKDLLNRLGAKPKKNARYYVPIGSGGCK